MNQLDSKGTVSQTNLNLIVDLFPFFSFIISSIIALEKWLPLKDI